MPEQLTARLREVTEGWNSLGLVKSLQAAPAWRRVRDGRDTSCRGGGLPKVRQGRPILWATSAWCRQSTRPGRLAESKAQSRKQSNAHVRRALVESSWHYRRQPRMRKQALRQRGVNLSPKSARSHGRLAKRLHNRFGRLIARGKPSPKAVTAVARQIGWICLGNQPKESSTRGCSLQSEQVT